MATKPILSREVINFLESNFVVYDPVYRECYQDFSGFGNCQVYLIGSMHHSNVIENIQRKFFETVSGDEDVCVIAEGLSIGVTLNDAERAEFLGLPSTLPIHVIGGDVRHQAGSAKFVEVMKLYQKVRELEAADQEHVAVYFRQLAGKLNDDFRSGSLKVDSKGKKAVVSDEQLKEIHREFERMIEEKTEREKEIKKNETRRSQLVERESNEPEVEKSNTQLFQEIQKACKQFSKVVVPWGKGHFLCESQLMRALDQARISYLILFPTAQREREAIDEICWATQTMPRLAMTLSAEPNEFTLQVPKVFQSYFHPALQSIHPSMTKEPIVLYAQKFIELSKEGTVFQFPAEQPIHFEHIPLEDYQMIDALCGAESERLLSQEKHLKLQGLLLGLLNNLLMLGGMKVNSINFEGLILASYTCLKNKLVFELESDKPFEITLSHGVMMGYASHLFNEMKRLNLKSYEIKPNNQLFFFDLSIEEREEIIKTPQKIIGWLQSKLPPGSQLTTAGALIIKSATIRPFEGHSSQEGVMLTTTKGFRFILT